MASVGDPPVVASARVTAPPLRPTAVPRTTLLRRLLETSSTLSVISGPAGSGKTTLMAQCHDAEPYSAWLSVGDAKNDPVVFWWALIESLRCVIDDFGSGYRARLRAAGQAALPRVIPSVANELAERGLPVRLLIDDLHRLTDEECRRALHDFIDVLPPTVRVVVASRGAPPIPLARRRLEGALLEIGEGDLAMSRVEARTLLGNLGVGLDEDRLGTLLARTEGWTAGLQLAGMALADAPDAAAAADVLVATRGGIAEYLVSEVLDDTPSDERDFMLSTCLLERLSGALCDAVVGRGGSDGLLRSLAERNAFLVPLDPRGEWFRYHHLFAELLHSELAGRDDLDPVVLHGRAFDWLRDAGHVDEAIHHGLAAGRRDEVADLFCSAWWGLFADGRLASARSALGLFTASEIANHAPLALAAAMVAGLSNDRESARRHLAEAALAEPSFEGPPPDGTRSIVSSRCLAASFLALDGIEQALADGSAVLALEPPDSPWRPLATLIVGLARSMRGEMHEARSFLEEASAAPDPTITAYAFSELANLQLRLGEPARAAATGEEARRLVRDAGLGDTFLATTAGAAEGLALAAIGDAERARSLLRSATSPDRSREGLPMDVLHGELLAAELALELAEPDIARRALDRASRVAGEISDIGAMEATLGDLTARLGETVPPADAASQETAPTFTRRELDILKLLETELSTREIAEELFLSRNTVKTYQRRIYRKVGASSRADAVLRARGLMESGAHA